MDTRSVPASSPATAVYSRRWWALAVIGLAQLMVVLDTTIVNIALPSAQADLGVSDGGRQWVVTAYTLAFGGLLLLGGRVGDLIGRKRAFVIGLVGFAAASALGGFSVTFGMLLASRALQGVFAALLAPAALSLLTLTFADPRDRGRAFGVFGAIGSGGNALGLVLGGVLTEYLDWRWCLLVNAPIAIAAVVGAAWFVRDHRTPAQGRGRLDVPGALLITGGLVAVVYALSQAEQDGFASALVISLFVLAALLITGFVLVERNTAHPLLPLRVLADRNRIGALSAVALTAVSLFGAMLFLSYYLQTVLGWPAVWAGLSFLPLTAGTVVGSILIAGRLMPRIGSKAIMLPGLLLSAAAFAYLTQITVDSSWAVAVLPGIIALGLGLGMTMGPAMSTATFGVAGPDAGVASALVNTSQQVGGSVGIALLNTVAASVTATALGSAATGSEAAATVQGFTTAMWIPVGALLLAAILVTALVNPQAGRRLLATQ